MGIVENDTRTGFIAEIYDGQGYEQRLQIALDNNNNNVWVLWEAFTLWKEWKSHFYSNNDFFFTTS